MNSINSYDNKQRLHESFRFQRRLEIDFLFFDTNNLIATLIFTLIFVIYLLTTTLGAQECCEIDNIFEKGFLFLLLF